MSIPLCVYLSSASRSVLSGGGKYFDEDSPVFHADPLLNFGREIDTETKIDERKLLGEKSYADR